MESAHRYFRIGAPLILEWTHQSTGICSYRLMFEDRNIELMTYTPETLLAEKIQTILARGITTTRMRDYYDVYEMQYTD